MEERRFLKRLLLGMTVKVVDPKWMLGFTGNVTAFANNRKSILVDNGVEFVIAKRTQVRII